MSTSVVDIRDAAVAIGGRPVLRQISLTVRAGEFVALMGANGSGKSTLVRAMTGLRPLSGGRVHLFGTALGDFRDWQRIGFVPQRSGAASGVPASVWEVVASGRLTRRRWFRPLLRADRAAIADALDVVGLSGRTRDGVATLSGGQQQRVLIAKALVNDPKLLILDEPATGVDLETQNRFYALLKKLNQEKKITIIWASHDLDAVNRIASSVACINRSMFFHGATHEFFENSDLLKAYSESSMQAHMHLHDHDHK